LLTNWKLNRRRTRVPVLIFANKSEKPEAVKGECLSRYFRLQSVVVDRPLKIIWGSAVMGAEVQQSMMWLRNEIKKCRKSPEQQESTSFISWLL